MRLAALCLALFVGLPATAATYRIDVTGGFDSASFTMVYSSDGSRGRIELSPDAQLLSDHHSSGLLSETWGTALFDESTGAYSECGGLLQLMCRAAFADRRTSVSDGLFRSFGNFGMMQLDGTSVQFTTDGMYRWTEDGASHVAVGFTASGQLETVSISAVPLPPAGLALVMSLGALALLGRRQRTLHRG